MDLQSEQTEGFRVEVSGWDASENFFVEKTELNWRGNEKKEVLLRCALREGSLVFVRLLQPPLGGNNLPIAYKARRIGARQADGRRQVDLAKMHPRPTRAQDSDCWANSIRVA